MNDHEHTKGLPSAVRSEEESLCLLQGLLPLIPARLPSEGDLKAGAGGKSADETFPSEQEPEESESWVAPLSSDDPSSLPDGAASALACAVRTETETRDSELRYRRLFESARDGILILDPFTRKIIDANPFMSELLRYTRQELVGKELWEIGLLSDEEASRAAFEEIRKSHFLRYEDLPLQSKKGESRQVEFISNLYKEGVRPVIQCNVRDITERKWAEDRIAEQAAFLDKATDAIIACDPEGKISFWNKGAERMYGWAAKEVIRRNVGEVLYAEEKQYDEFHDLTLKGDEWSGEVRHMTKSRGEIFVETRWTLIRDSAGRPKTILAINSDVTGKKKMEVLAMRAQRMESLGTLAGGIAHDLNNILAPIMMSIDTLQRTSDNPTTRKILHTIEVSARRGADIVGQVLSFARGMDGERIEVQPRHLLRDLEAIIKGTFPKSINMHFTLPDNVSAILGDPTQIHLVLVNLCVNARDAMPDGGELNVNIENCVLHEHYDAKHMAAKPGRYVKIAVSDSGTGIAPQLLEKIFDPFFTTKDLTKGTGLGLSTVMAIVKSHEGIINVYSEPGNGSTFTAYFPAMELVAEEKDERSTFDTLPRGDGEVVLLVDDEISILTVTGHTLEAFGYEVLTARNGREAVALYLQHQDEIALVLTDMTMPIMDGKATIRALTEANPAVRIVATSGLSTNGEGEKITGATAFLPKPYTAEKLLVMVRTVIAGQEKTRVGPAGKL